jgi:hypothetical protein
MDYRTLHPGLERPFAAESAALAPPGDLAFQHNPTAAACRRRGVDRASCTVWQAGRRENFRQKIILVKYPSGGVGAGNEAPIL